MILTVAILIGRNIRIAVKLLSSRLRNLNVPILITVDRTLKFAGRVAGGIRAKTPTATVAPVTTRTLTVAEDSHVQLAVATATITPMGLAYPIDQQHIARPKDRTKASTWKFSVRDVMKSRKVVNTGPWMRRVVNAFISTVLMFMVDARMPMAKM